MWSKIHFGIPEFPLTISYTSFGHGNDGIRDANHESPRDIVAHRNHLPHRKFQAGPPRNRGSGGKGLLVPFSCHPKRMIPSGNQTWLENGAFTDDFPIQTSIYRGFSMAIHIVYIDCPLVISQKYGKIHHFHIRMCVFVCMCIVCRNCCRIPETDSRARNHSGYGSFI